MFKAGCLNQVNIMHHVSLQNAWIVQLGSPSHDCEMQQFTVSEKAGMDVSAWTWAGYKWWIGITAFNIPVQFYQFPKPLAQKTSPAARPYEDSTFTYSGLAFCLHSSPHGLKILTLFFSNAKHWWSTPLALLLSSYLKESLFSYPVFSRKIILFLSVLPSLEFTTLENHGFNLSVLWDNHIFTHPHTYIEGSPYLYESRPAQQPPMWDTVSLQNLHNFAANFFNLSRIHISLQIHMYWVCSFSLAK